MSSDPEVNDQLTLLLEKARRGENQALGELLVHYRQYLVFLARAQVHDQLQAKVDPSDIAQEVCLAAQTSIRDFNGGTSEEFAGWLRGILSNVLAMQFRKYLGSQKRDLRLEQNIQQRLASASGFLQSGIAGDFTSPSQHFARNEASLRLADALENLPEDYRQVIVMRHMDGLPFAEIARKMGRSVDSVEKLWVRGLAKLKQSIGES